MSAGALNKYQLGGLFKTNCLVGTTTSCIKTLRHFLLIFEVLVLVSGGSRWSSGLTRDDRSIYFRPGDRRFESAWRNGSVSEMEALEKEEPHPTHLISSTFDDFRRKMWIRIAILMCVYIAYISSSSSKVIVFVHSCLIVIKTDGSTLKKKKKKKQFFNLNESPKCLPKNV